MTGETPEVRPDKRKREKETEETEEIKETEEKEDVPKMSLEESLKEISFI